LRESAAVRSKKKRCSIGHSLLLNFSQSDLNIFKSTPTCVFKRPFNGNLSLVERPE
jgi:hypothetical protein